MPAKLEGKVNPARRNALFSAMSATTIDNSDAPEARGDKPLLATGAGTGGGATTMAFSASPSACGS